MIAVRVLGSHHQRARQGRWAASQVLTVCGMAPINSLMTSPNPSPPSLIGNNSRLSSGRARRQPRAIAFAAAPAVRVPLNLSGTIRILSGIVARVGGLIDGVNCGGAVGRSVKRVKTDKTLK